MLPEKAMAEFNEYRSSVKNPFSNSTERADILKNKNGYINAVHDFEKARMHLVRNKERINNQY